MKTTRRTERWYQPDSGAEWVPIVSTVVGPTVAQLAGACQPAGLEEQVGTGQSWYQPDAEVVPGPLRAARYQVDGGPGTDTPGSYPWTVGHDTATTYFRLDEPFNTQSGPETAGWYTAYDSVALLADFRFAQWTGIPVSAKPGLLALGAEGRPIPDTAAGFDGASYVLLANTNSDNATTSPFSVEAWFRTSSGATQIIVGRGGYGAVAGWQLSLTSAGAVQLNVSDGAGSASATSGNGFNDGLVHHAVGVRSGVNVAIYVDGSLRAQNNDSITRNVSTADPFTVGVRSSITFFFTGDLDEVAFYSGTALSAAQVEQHYLLGTQGWAPMVQQADWSESAPNGQQWFAPDAEVFGISPFAPSVATVAQQAGVHQPGYDEQVDHSQTWFAPDEAFWVPIPGLTQATVARQPIQQPSADEELDHSQTWYAADEYALAWVPIPNLTQSTVAQDAGLWYEQPGQESGNGQAWFAPDEAAQTFFVAAAVGPTTAQLAGLWQEQPGQEAANAQSWFAPEEAVSGIPPFAPSSATTAQQAGIHQSDPSEQVSRVATWYQPDTGAEFVPQTYAHVSQDIVEALFADPAAAGRVSQDVIEVLYQLLPDPPVFDWTDHSPQFWNYPFWFQDEHLAWTSFTPAPPAVTVPQEAGLWQEQVEPTSSQQTWFAPEESFWTPIPNLTVATTAQEPIQQPSADEDRDRTQTWFAPEEMGSWTPIPNLMQATTAQEPVQVDDPSEQADRTTTWFQDEHQSWVPIPNLTVATTAQDAGLWQEQPYPEAGNQQQWFAPDESFWISLAAPSNATVAQEPIQQPGTDEDVDRTQRWYQEPDDTFGVPPFQPSSASVAQQAALWSEPGPDEQVDHSQRWYEEPDDMLGAVPIIVTTATVAQQAGIWQEQPYPEAGNQPTWFTPESEWTPIPNLTVATIAQEPIQVASDDEQVDRTQFWFQDEHRSWTPIPNLAGDLFPLKQVDDPSEQVSNAQVWFAPDAEVQTFLPFETEATTAQEPIQQPSADEEVGRDVRWYQEPDDALGIPPFQPSTATVAQQVAATQRPDWSEEADRTVTWFAPDEQAPVGIPPFQPSSATVAQDAGLWIDGSGQQDASIAQTWFQDETCQFISVLSFITFATVPQQAPLWIEQPIAWNDGTPWFSPEESFDGQPPRPNAPTHPDYGWDAQQDRDLTQTWFAPDAAVEGFVPRANAPTAPDYGWDASLDRDLTVRWYQAEGDEAGFWTPIPNLTQATTAQEPIQQPSPDEELDRTVRWYQEPDDALGIPPFAPSVASVAQQAALWQEQPVAWDDRTPWFAPDELAWVPIPTLTVDPTPWKQEDDPSEQVDRTQTWFFLEDQFVFTPSTTTVAQYPVQTDDPSEQIANGQTWFQPDAEQAWVSLAAPSTATVAQEPIQQPGVDEDRDRVATWYQPDTGAEWVPIPNLTLATIAQEPIQQPSADEEVDRTVTWFQVDAEQAWVPIPTVPFPAFQEPVQQDDWSEAADRTQTWFAPDEQVWTPQAVQPTRAAIPQVASDDEQVDRTVTWFQDEHLSWVPIPNLTVASVAQDAGLWQEQPGQEASIAARWFQPDDAYETPVPSSFYTPTTPQFAGLNNQPNLDEQLDRTVRWFAPEESFWTPIPNLTQPTVAQRAGATQAYERVEQLDLSVRWYQPEDDYLGYSPLTYHATVAKVTATDAAVTLATGTDAATLVSGTDQASTLVTGADAGVILVTASDAPAVLVTATDQ